MKFTEGKTAGTGEVRVVVGEGLSTVKGTGEPGSGAEACSVRVWLTVPWAQTGAPEVCGSGMRVILTRKRKKEKERQTDDRQTTRNLGYLTAGVGEGRGGGRDPRGSL